MVKACRCECGVIPSGGADCVCVCMYGVSCGGGAVWLVLHWPTLVCDRCVTLCRWPGVAETVATNSHILRLSSSNWKNHFAGGS